MYNLLGGGLIKSPLRLHDVESTHLVPSAVMNVGPSDDLYIMFIVYLRSRLVRNVYSCRSTIINRTMYSTTTGDRVQMKLPF